jgi:peptidoglycan/xylan/chitin deacetylase (PgdA/CDA1 family)
MMPLIFASLMVAIAIGVAIFFYACTVPSSRIFRPVVSRGPRDQRHVALTFDDGPSAPFTEQILDALREKNVTATFFVCGDNAERHPEIVRRISREGHALGNHTYSHPFLLFKSRRKIAEEIDRAQKVIEKIAGVRPVLFRPPYGIRWPGLMPVLAERGMKMVMWSATGYDWKYKADAIVRATIEELKPGAVILLHDGREARPATEVDRSGTVAALPTIIDKAREAGFTFVSLQDFL